MAKYSEAQKEAVRRYKEKNDLVEMRVTLSREKREEYKQHAASKGESLNSYIIGLIEKDIAEDKKTK